MEYFTYKSNQKVLILFFLLSSILSLVISIAGIANLQVTKGEAYAFTGNLFLASFTIFFSLIFSILFSYLYIKLDKANVLDKFSAKTLTFLFILFLLLSSINFIASVVVFIERNDTFRWYDGWWRNFGLI